MMQAERSRFEGLPPWPVNYTGDPKFRDEPCGS